MPYSEIERLSPNCDANRRHERWGVLFHHTELDFEATVGRMLDPASRVSYHVVIGLDGRRCRLVPDEHIAWHAGVSKFLGRDGCNDFLLGVAFEGDTALRPITGDQMASALEWLGERWTAQGWSLGRMTDHRQVSPGRKRDLDPGEWERLRAVIARRFGAKEP